MCMPKSMSSRLEDLENEIHVMLTLQDPGASCCKGVVQGASVASYADGKVDKISYGGAAFQTKENKKVAMAVTTPKSKKRPSSSPEASSRKHRSSAKEEQQGDGAHQELRCCSAGAARDILKSETKSCICTQPPKQPTCLCAQRREAALKKCICGPKGRNEQPGAGTGAETGAGTGAMDEENLQKLKNSEALIAELNARIEEITKKLNETELAKKAAINASNECKEKYGKLLSGKSSETAELAKLRKEKEELSKKLEKVEESRRNLDEQAAINAEREKKALMEQVEKIESHAVKSVKSVRNNSNQLASAMHQKDDHIRKLSATVERLADNIREKDLEIKKLHMANKDMIENYIEAQIANRKLGDTNAALVRSIKEFQEKLQAERGTVQKLQKQIFDCKEESKKAAEEMERLKEKLKQLLQGPKDIRELARLREKLREAREREQKYIDEEAYMQAKLKEMQDNQKDAGKKVDSELDRLTKDHKKLQAKYEELLKTLDFTKQEHQKKIAVMEGEFQSFSKEMQGKLNVAAKQKADLQADFDALTASAKTDRQTLEDVLKRTQQQDQILKSQQDIIATRDKQLATANTQISELKSEAVQLNKKIQNLETSLETSEKAKKQLEERTSALQAELLQGKMLLQEKEKLIAEQTKKIQELNSVVSEAEKKLKRLESLEQELRKQTGGGRKMEGPMMMDEDGQVSVRGKDAGDGNLVTSLEQKISVLQREAALHIKLVEKQKEHAIIAAQFATTKLMETVCDFYEQVKTHKQIQYMLTKMLEEKEAQLDPVCPKACVSKKSVRIKDSKSNKSCSNPKCKNYQPQ